MVEKLSIGVIGIQGAVTEHISNMQNVLKQQNIPGNVFILKNKTEIENVDALILPGGESTTISKILNKTKLYQSIKKRIDENNLAIMGTCAGCVLLASSFSDENNDDIKLFEAIDMHVERNAFGRQKESFEKTITIKGFNEPYNAVFIRAPLINKVGEEVEVLSRIDEKNIIMARQKKFLALSFHPELTDDLRIHKYFLDMI